MDHPNHLFGDLIVNVITTGSSTRLEPGTRRVSVTEKRQPRLLPTRTRKISFDGFLLPLRKMKSAVHCFMADVAIKAQAQCSNIPGQRIAVAPLPKP
jgi:hypothetical protein